MNAVTKERCVSCGSFLRIARMFDPHDFSSHIDQKKMFCIHAHVKTTSFLLVWPRYCDHVHSVDAGCTVVNGLIFCGLSRETTFKR